MLSKRTQFGLLSLVLLTAAGVLWLMGIETTDYAPILSPLMRLGLVLGAVWIAWPQITKLPIWLATVGIVTVVAFLIFKKAALVLIPLLVLIYFLRPRPPKRQAANQESLPSNRSAK